MAIFLNIAPSKTKTDDGIRLTVREDGEMAWFHGKWLDLAPNHAVAWIEGSATFTRADGKTLLLGAFPAWQVRSKKKNGAAAIMFNAAQFDGGYMTLKQGKHTRRFDIRCSEAHAI